MDWERRWRRYKFSVIAAIAILLILAAVVQTNPGRWEYDVSYAGSSANFDLDDLTGSTGATASQVPLPFGAAPYNITATLTWATDGTILADETMTLTLIAPDGTVIQTAQSATGVASLSASPGSSTSDRMNANSTSESNVHDDAAASIPPDAHGQSGWIMQIERTPNQQNAADQVADWTMEVSYTTYVGTAYNVDEVERGINQWNLVGWVAVGFFIILGAIGAFYGTNYSRYKGKTVDGWDRISSNRRRRK